MHHIKLNGTNLSSVGYDAMTRKMEVTFLSAPGWLYTYEQVPLALYGDIVLHERPGPYFYRMVRSRPDLFPYKRVRFITGITK